MFNGGNISTYCLKFATSSCIMNIEVIIRSNDEDGYKVHTKKEVH